MKNNSKKSIKGIVLPLVIVLCGLVAWQVAEDYVNELRYIEGKTSLEFFIPTPLTILQAGLDNYQQIAKAMGQTLTKALVGFAVGVIFAVMMTILYSLLPVLRPATLPIAFAIQSFPVVGIAPAVVLAFGQDSFMSIVFISALLTYFPILLSFDDAFKNIDREYLDLSFVYNADRLQTLRYVKFPLAMPAFLTALKLAVPSSIVGATIGEWMGSSSGIGRVITLALYQLKPGILYCCLILLATLSASTVLLINLIEQFCFPWISLQRPQHRQEGLRYEDVLPQ